MVPILKFLSSDRLEKSKGHKNKSFLSVGSIDAHTKFHLFFHDVVNTS